MSTWTPTLTDQQVGLIMDGLRLVLASQAGLQVCGLVAEVTKAIDAGRQTEAPDFEPEYLDDYDEPLDEDLGPDA